MAGGGTSGTRQRGYLTPLWIIGLFVSFTQAIAGLAITKATGGVQVTLIVFAIGFPCLIVAAFFLFLWHRPYVFYSPSEFGSQDVTRYVEAMRGRSLTEEQVLMLVRKTVETSLESDSAVAALNAALPTGTESWTPQLKSALSRIAEDAVRRVDEATVAIDVTPITRVPNDVRLLAYDGNQQMWHFLNIIYAMIQDIVDPYTFGKQWALENQLTGSIIKDAGRLWARKRRQLDDDRVIGELGITAGTKLRAVLI